MANPKTIREAEARVRERLGEGYSVVKLSQYWLVWQTDAKAETLTQSTSLDKAIRDQAARPKLPSQPQQPAAKLLQVRPVVSTEGVLYQPWTDGYAVGFKATHPDGRVEFVYLNPSSESDDGQPTVFLYRGTAGTAEQDAPLTHIEIFPSQAGRR
jgi:hypothetical protein